MTDTAAVLERIHERLRAQDMSVRAAEEQAGHPNWIRHLAAGRVRSVNMTKLAAFAPVLGTTLGYLAHGEGEPSRPALPPPRPEDAGAILRRLRASQDVRREAGRLRTPPALLSVRGEVAAGHWLQIDQHDEPAFEPVDLPADRRWPAEWQYGLVVRGTSINNVAPDGAFLLCVDVKAIRHQMRDGELIIVEQRKDGGHMIERTAKRYKRRGHLHELWPDSSDPRWREPIVIDPTREDESLEVEMVGLVVWVHMPVLPILDFDPRGDVPALTHEPGEP